MNMATKKHAPIPMLDLTLGLPDLHQAANMTGLEQLTAIVDQRFPAPQLSASHSSGSMSW